MGLLDGNLDPQTMASLQLAGGLLSPGSFGQGLQKGLNGYQDALGNSQMMRLREQQIATGQQEQQMRELQMRRTLAQLQEEGQFGQGNAAQGMPNATQQQPMQSFMSGSGQRTPDQNATGMASANAAPAPQSQQIGGAASNLPPGVVAYKGMPLERLRSRINIGLEPKDAMEIWKAANFGTPFQPGYVRNADGTSSFFGNPKDGVTMDAQGTVGTMPGYLNTQSAITGATKTAEIRAANAQTPVPLDRLDRMPSVSPTSSIDDLLNPKPAAAPPPQMPGVSASQMNAVMADNKRLGAPPFTINGQQMGGAASPAMPAASGGFKSAAELAAEAAGAKVTAENKANLASKPALTSADDFARNAQASDKTYSDELNKKVEEGLNIKARNVEIIAQLSDYKAGISNPEIRAKVASNLINMFPDSPKIRAAAESINGGSVVSAETLNFLIAGAAVTNAIQVLDGQGKLTNGVRAQLQTAAESAATDPGALKRIISIQNKFADRDIAEQSARASSIKASTYHPETWQADYAQIRNNQITTTPGNNATVLPNNPTASVLKVGEVYQLPNGHTGKWDGFKFRGQ